MFAPQIAARPPSSCSSLEQQDPLQTREELEAGQAEGSLPPVFSPSLHLSLRKDHKFSTSSNNTSESASKLCDLHPHAPTSHISDSSDDTLPPSPSSSPSPLAAKNPNDYAANNNADNERSGQLSAASRESKSRGKRKPVQIFFRPQTSILDYTELMYQGSDRMRGLVTCFWTIVGAYLVSLLASHYESNGEIMSLSLGSLIFSRGMDLMLSDLALVVSTAFVVPLVRICWVGWQKPGIFDPHSRQSMAIQALAEIIWLVVWYSWQGTRGWPWSQRCFFALHTMVNWMKIHSYTSTNRRLAGIQRTKNELIAEQKRSLDEQDNSTNDEGTDLDSEIASLEAELCPYTVRFPANLTL
ncbi:Sterol O-acyltransferase 2 (Sterol-ester synthase 2), partial [Kickxella alabastrina]